MRDFVYVKDVIDMMMWFFQNSNQQGLFNAGTGEARSFLDLASAVFQSLNKKPVIKFVDTPSSIRGKYQYETQADMKKIRDFGYKKKPMTLEEGISDYVKNYLEAEDKYL